MNNVKFASEDCYNFKYPSTYIIAACVKHGDTLYAGMRHNICINAIIKDGFNAVGCDQGFIDNHGKFYDRYEALELAKETGQLQRKTGSITMLFSEDLW